MYGSTCADMQVDVMGECLSSIKHVVGTTSGCFYPRSNHWEVGGRPCVTSVLQSSELLTASFHDFEENFKLQEQLSGGSVVVVHEEPHPQMTGTLSYRPEETGGRQWGKSLDTRHRRLDDRYRVLPWPEDCTVVVCTTPYESRFSLSSDSHRILIWRERGSRNYPSNIIERDRYGGHGVLVWGSIMLGSRTDLHIFDAGSVNGTRYCNEILLPYVRLFRGAMGLQFLFMDDNAPCHRTVAAKQLLESEDIERMDWPARSPDLNPIEHVWDFLDRRLTARTLPPVTIRELRLALQDEWAAMPQQLIDTLILSMGRRCETCLAVDRPKVTSGADPCSRLYHTPTLSSLRHCNKDKGPPVESLDLCLGSACDQTSDWPIDKTEAVRQPVTQSKRSIAFANVARVLLHQNSEIGSFAMREKGGNHLPPGPYSMVDALKLPNQAPRVSGESLQTCVS
ncbi:transposable element Tcb2 transposase [Trichonephila clavipes]|nr:transposable element Tcb2 transposase [Trichonephila clavipes]